MFGDYFEFEKMSWQKVDTFKKEARFFDRAKTKPGLLDRVYYFW